MNTIEFRQQIIEDAIGLKEPARVPVIPISSYYQFEAYGCSLQQNMYDVRSCFDAYIQFHKDFAPDAALGNPCVFSGQALDILEPKYIKWPGKIGGLPSDAKAYQFLENLYPIIREEEWEEVLNNRTGWLLTKFLPRNFKALEPLEHFDLGYASMGAYIHLGPLANPKVQEALQKLQQALAVSMDYMKANMELGMILGQMGYPGFIGGSLMVPYDLIGDNALGTEPAFYAMMEHPDELLELTNRVADEIVQQARMIVDCPSPVNKIWFFLHKGMDGFMNDEQYRKFYFEPLLKIIKVLTEHGLVPVLQCQGRYDTRMDYLAQLPKGKCVCLFEQVDMKEAKRKLGGKVCIAGNLSASLLMFGKKEDVVNETKRQIDEYGPGGGYIFSTDATIDAAKKENMEAMFDTALSYGEK